MKSFALTHWFAVLALLALAGCAGTKSNYPGAAEQHERAEANAMSDASTGAITDSVGTYLKLVERMQRDGLWFASLAHIDALEQRWGSSPDSTRMRADALRQTDQVEESRKLYEKLLGTPIEAAGYRGLGLIAGGEADYLRAVRMLEQAQRRAPTDGGLLSDLGYAQMRAGRLAQARVPLMQALQLAPENPQVHANAALYLQASGQAAQAQALMEDSKMPAATRAAIQEAARDLLASYSVAASAGATAAPAASANTLPIVTTVTPVARTVVAPEESRQPLLLKTASWPRRIHVMVRPQANTPAQPETTTMTTADAAEILQPVPTTGAQP
ncbi:MULTISPECIES: hypothetical protein [unclassified Variovorax]|uniref:tetratricopeptide repeat protein n=1 Tax=unclassified Variovorax TaxID=663243 RepID=UPI0025752E7C|nr:MULTISPECIES: hypothetical protein [unclassified Variovorax]MDM0087708.1 hypothetical protein [Variovorax sp. J22G40]MDM0144035.1 hypothetical protein [Variovorax sp. J2P1-31]